jgi:hypothetical protein
VKPDEVVLRGGFTNDGLVSRAGATVRRPERPTSPATRALPERLERAGFDGSPRHLGRGEQGREVLSFVDGEAPIEPFPAWALTDEALVSVGELLRGYHDAVASFDPAGHRWPRTVPAAFGGDLLCHNDPNLDNVVFSGGRATALIDFDLAAPGSAVWDVACAVRFWAPLRARRVQPLLGGRWPGARRAHRGLARGARGPPRRSARLTAAVRGHAGLTNERLRAHMSGGLL